jgi:NAD(P)-dependent dehydrogenase (short-subunit alcohol dehydrogenase family)
VAGPLGCCLGHIAGLFNRGTMGAVPPPDSRTTPSSGRTLPSATPMAPIDADLSGKVAVVTGSTAGIGHEVASDLAALGCRVVVVARSQAKADAAREALIARGRDPDRFETAVADLARIPQVQALADELAQRFPRLDILVNNAGCYPAGRQITPEGVEESWATNVLAYEILTSRLQEPLRAAGGRIVYVASTMAGKLEVDDLLWQRRRWSGTKAYSQSKQANRMLAWAWDRRLAGTGITINVAHPDGTATNIAHRQRGVFGLLARWVFRRQRPPAEGADTVTWLAAAPELSGISGGFFHNRTPIDCEWRDAVDAGDRLWTLTQEQVS